MRKRQNSKLNTTDPQVLASLCFSSLLVALHILNSPPTPVTKLKGSWALSMFLRGWFGQIPLEMNLVVHSGENVLNYNTPGSISWGPVCKASADARPQ